MPFPSHPSRKKTASSSLSLFQDSAPAIPDSYLIAHVDGGSRGNPGHAGYGVSVTDSDGSPVTELSQYLGIQTNNFAEYSGLLAALRFAHDRRAKAVEVVSDSELMVRQLNGQYKVKNEGLKPLYQEAISLIRSFEWFKVRHVRREFNKDADRLANLAMDRKR